MAIKTYTTYHVFTNEQDEWLDDYNQAVALYNEFIKEHGNARLYRETRISGISDAEDADIVISETCLEFGGEWPW